MTALRENSEGRGQDTVSALLAGSLLGSRGSWIALLALEVWADGWCWIAWPVCTAELSLEPRAQQGME